LPMQDASHLSASETYAPGDGRLADVSR
jgi:hypothetical protein